MPAPLNTYLVPERKLGFFVKIKPPASLPARRAHRPEGKAYAPEGKTKILTTPVRSAGPTPVLTEVSLATALRMAAGDLKAYYMEVVTAQPGQPTGGGAFANWFWGQTVAARIINTIREVCLEISDDEFPLLRKVLLVPRTQLHKLLV